MGANILGTGFYVSQELLWETQRMQLKYSFRTTKYAAIRPNTLGDGFLEQVLKDYNGQTYWLSANIYSFFPETKLPKWLSIAAGYGVEGLLTGSENTDILAFKDQDRRRQFYLSLDAVSYTHLTLPTIYSV